MIIPSAKYRKYQEDAGRFLRGKFAKVEDPVNIKAIYYMPTRRRVDLTNLHEALHGYKYAAHSRHGNIDGGIEKMKNTLGDLNNHLFAQIERLGDEELQGEELEREIGRAKAVTSVASQIIANGRLVLKAQEFADDKWNAESKVPKMLQGGE